MFLFAFFFSFCHLCPIFTGIKGTQLVSEGVQHRCCCKESIVDEDVTLKNKARATTVCGWDMSFCLTWHGNTALEMSYFMVCT